MNLWAQLINPRSRRLDPSSIPVRSRSDFNLWGRLVGVMKVLLVASVVVLLFTIFLPTIQQAQHYEAQKTELQTRITQAQQMNVQLQREFDSLKSNPEHLERVARDTLGLGRAGEVIFRFEPYDTARSGKSSEGTR
jgi:cell division protein FtsB